VAFETSSERHAKLCLLRDCNISLVSWEQLLVGTKCHAELQRRSLVTPRTHGRLGGLRNQVAEKGVAFEVYLNLYQRFQDEPEKALAEMHAGLAEKGDEDRVFALAELSFFVAENSPNNRFVRNLAPSLSPMEWWRTRSLRSIATGRPRMAPT
jgi:hypothetical protein